MEMAETSGSRIIMKGLFILRQRMPLPFGSLGSLRLGPLVVRFVVACLKASVTAGYIWLRDLLLCTGKLRQS